MYLNHQLQNNEGFERPPKQRSTGTSGGFVTSRRGPLQRAPRGDDIEVAEMR